MTHIDILGVELSQSKRLEAILYILIWYVDSDAIASFDSAAREVVKALIPVTHMHIRDERASGRFS